MTVVGKILVVLHLVFAFLFMAFAGAVYTAQTNWRTARDNVQKQLEDANRKVQERTTELEQAQTAATQKQRDLENQVAQLTGQNNTLVAENTSLQAERARLQSAYDSQREVAALTSQEAAERVKEAQQQRARNLELQASRDALIVKNRELEDLSFGQKVQLEQLTGKHTSLVQDLATMRSYLLSQGLPAEVRDMKVETSPPPSVDGIVLDQRKADKGNSEYVEISLGSDDGLTKGHDLTVYRNDRFLGRIRLVYVTPDRAVGSVIEKAKNQTIQRGDNVSTKL